MGLINEVTGTPEEALARATSLAHRLAAQPRGAVAMTKRMLRAGASGNFHTSLEIEALSQASALGSHGARTAFQAFQDR
jgi:2-(1,2-epoxy-1,2-dihydrophenyl)acetyl-CoA isomerase